MRKTALWIKKRLPAALLALALCLAGGAAAETKESVVGYQLDTIITLTADCEDKAVLEDALKECDRLEQLLSKTIEGSDVWRINHAEGQPVEVDPVTAEVIRTALAISEISEMLTVLSYIFVIKSVTALVASLLSSRLAVCSTKSTGICSPWSSDTIKMTSGTADNSKKNADCPAMAKMLSRMSFL